MREKLHDDVSLTVQFYNIFISFENVSGRAETCKLRINLLLLFLKF